MARRTMHDGMVDGRYCPGLDETPPGRDPYDHLRADEPSSDCPALDDGGFGQQHAGQGWGSEPTRART